MSNEARRSSRQDNEAFRVVELTGEMEVGDLARLRGLG